MLHTQKLYRPAALLLATLVAGLSFTCLQRAVATVAVPNAGVLVYNLAAGANSPTIAVGNDRPVFVVANSTTPGNRGTGFVSIEKDPGSFLEWAGLNSVTQSGAPTITGGFSGAGATIVQIDYSTPGSGVTLQVSSANDSIVVHNGTGGTQIGSVLLVY